MPVSGCAFNHDPVKVVAPQNPPERCAFTASTLGGNHMLIRYVQFKETIEC